MPTISGGLFLVKKKMKGDDELGQVWQFYPVYPEVYRWHAVHQPTGSPVATARSPGGVRAHGPETRATGFHICRQRDLRRLYAGNGDGERPPIDLSAVDRGAGIGRRRAPSKQTQVKPSPANFSPLPFLQSR